MRLMIVGVGQRVLAEVISAINCATVAALTLTGGEVRAGAAGGGTGRGGWPLPGGSRVGVWVKTGVGDAASGAMAALLAVAVALGVREAVGVSLAVACIRVADGVWLGVSVCVAVSVSVGVSVGMAVKVAVSLGVGVCVGSGVSVKVGVADGASVGVSEGVMSCENKGGYYQGRRNKERQCNNCNSFVALRISLCYWCVNLRRR